MFLLKLIFILQWRLLQPFWKVQSKAVIHSKSDNAFLNQQVCIGADKNLSCAFQGYFRCFCANENYKIMWKRCFSNLNNFGFNKKVDKILWSSFCFQSACVFFLRYQGTVKTIARVLRTKKNQIEFQISFARVRIFEYGCRSNCYLKFTFSMWSVVFLQNKKNIQRKDF